MTTSVTVKGQVTIPKSVREAAGLRPGDRVDVRATASGAVVMKMSRGESESFRPNKG